MRSQQAQIGVGVIGLGFMGRTHIAGYLAARKAGYPVRITALCDAAAERLEHGLDSFKPALPGSALPGSELRRHTDPAALLADERVQLVSICTPTDSHVDLAIRALAAGKHVLVEKPLAIRAADARRVISAAESSATLCMPAMCMRFWPGWSWLRERIQDGRFGAVLSAVFQRLGSYPSWSTFYQDLDRTGGALIDLHIHDADFVRWCFGDPAAVVSTGSPLHVTTLYRYPSGPRHVVAEAGWDHSPHFPFRMRYVVAFEKATAEFDSGREPPLLLAEAGPPEPVKLESVTGWDLEIRHLIDAISQGRRELSASVHDAVRVAEMLEAERRSLDSGALIPFA